MHGQLFLPLTIFNVQLEFGHRASDERRTHISGTERLVNAEETLHIES